MANDAYLEIIGESEGLVVQGESQDEVFGKKFAMELTSFRFGDVSAQKDSRELEYNKKKVGNLMTKVMNELRPTFSKSSTANTPLKDEEEEFKEQLTERLTQYISKDLAAYAIERQEQNELTEEEGIEKPTFTVDKILDFASPALMQAYCRTVSGLVFLPFPSARVSLRKRGGKNTLVYMILDFTNVVVVGYELDGNHDSEEMPKETVSFRFDTCKVSYRPQNIQGGFGTQVIAGFDFANNVDLQG